MSEPVATRAAPHPALKSYYATDGDRRAFVTSLFDGAAGHYDRVCGLMSFGSGQWYRLRALQRAGLRPGMKLLDVATGTGLVARAAARILVEPGSVIGVDPSGGMLRQARATGAALLVQGQVEELPFGDARFDFLTIGFALRHTADLHLAFRECLRVLKPGGRLLVLEISRAPSSGVRGAMRLYFTRVLPMLVRLGTRNRYTHLLMRYYWETIAACVPPEAILDALRGTGFVGVRRDVLYGCFSEYIADRPADGPVTSLP
jgi:demethylmenaquinone methyltransferase/2-methoxy-6-polyprenyl-1,4-benzoquinol methylase